MFHTFPAKNFRYFKSCATAFTERNQIHISVPLNISQISKETSVLKFPMKFANLSGTHFSQNTPWLLLKIRNSNSIEGFANSWYEVVLPILLQESINNFAVCKHCSGTLLLVEDVTSSHDFWKDDYIFQNGATFFNRSTWNMLGFYVTLHKSLYFLTNLVTCLVYTG